MTMYAQPRGSQEKGLQELADALFEEAQRLAPVNKGNLKAAGRVRVENNTIIVSYNVPYAYTLHEGGKEGDLIGGVDPKDFPWKAPTRGHWRRLSPGTTIADYYNSTVWVRPHIKDYGKKKTYYKPTLLDGGWVTINYQLDSKRDGRKWVQKAWTNIVQSQPRLIRTLLPANLTITPEYDKFA